VAERRIQHVLASLDTSGLGLEIGPSHNPLLPKRSGARIEIIDHAPREELIAKYRALEIPPDQIDQIEEVDYVTRGGSLVEAIGRTGVYDYIIGSNVIEHMTDLIGFLQDCDALLKPEGRLSLTVPDQRFCFDLLRPVTGIWEVIDAHHYPSRTHTPGTLLEFTTYSCQRGGEIAWNPTDDRPVTLRWGQPNGKELIQQGLDESEYHDAHRWTFTPSSFSLLSRTSASSVTTLS
jgi:SAM-dependent methyltransferase